MKAAAFEYVRARSVTEAATLLADRGGTSRLIAGGQSLGPMLNLRLARPAWVIDVRHASGLREVAADSATATIGAGFTHAEIEDRAIEDFTNGLLPHVARGIAYRAVRNRGTIGGSLAHADPAADWIATMAALGATVVAHGADGERRLPAETFMHSAYATALGDDEVLTAIEIPRFAPTTAWAYEKINRKTGEFAKAIGIAILDRSRGLARLLVGAVEGAPVLLPDAAADLLAGAPLDLGAEIARRLPGLAAVDRHLHAVAIGRAVARL